MGRNLINISDLGVDDFWSIIERARGFKSDNHSTYNTLRNKNISLLFFENSTRTKTSFEIATNKLSANGINFDMSSSSMKKGETLADTVYTVAAMGVDGIVVRHSDHQEIIDLTNKFKVPIINAGTGCQSHPTQAILDAYTIYENFKSFDLNIAIIGDVLHSRVARSSYELLTMLGARVSFGGPDEYISSEFKENHKPIDQLIEESDVVMMLRVQDERHDGHESIENYNSKYGLNSENLGRLKENAIILHPGPFNRGVEITDEVIKSDKCKILDQVTNGVYTRMAILDWALGL
jgi:aspartate carbamoyltransferase catalytic subunit